MANFVSIHLPHARRLSAVYDRIAIHRADTYDDTYAEITAAETRIPLEADEMAYVYVDTDGVPGNYYRYAFLSTTSAAASGLSDPIRGVGDMERPILSADELRRDFLFGIPLEDADGNPMDDAALEFHIASATAYTQKAIDIVIQPTSFSGEHPFPADQHDFYKQDYERYIWLKLLHVPVISVDEVKFTLPSSMQSVTFLPEWIKLDKVAGKIQIVPGGGQTAAIALGLSTMWLPVTQGLLNFIPETFEVSYTAGFADADVPADIKQIIGYLAAIDVLAIVGDLLFGPGVAGSDVGMDVLMTRLKTTRSDKASIFGARIKQYAERAKYLINEQRLIYKGIPFHAG